MAKAQGSINRMRLEERRLGYAFVTPALLFLFVFIFLSIAYSFYMSFFEWKLFDLGKSKTFVGLKNYLKIFSDEVFGVALGNTLLLTACCLVFELMFGFLIALALWTLKKQLRVIQTLILLPIITSPVIVGLLWRYIYDPQFGLLNYVLKNTLGVTFGWLGDPNLALPSIMITDIWQLTPFVILVLYAGMTSISEDCVEAAQVDGAGFWMTVRSVVLPSIAPMISFCALMRTMDLFKIFDAVFVLTKGGPGYATETVALYTYKTGFTYYEMGYPMALSIVTLLCILALSAGFLRKRKEERAK